MERCESYERSRRIFKSPIPYLLAMTVTFRLRKYNNANATRTKYNVGLLRDEEVQAAFKTSMRNRYEVLQELMDEEADIESCWEQSKKLWLETSEEVLGKKKKEHKEWVSAETEKKLETRKEKKETVNVSRTRAAKAKAREEYKAVDKEVMESIKKDQKGLRRRLGQESRRGGWTGKSKRTLSSDKKTCWKVSTDR